MRSSIVAALAAISLVAAPTASLAARPADASSLSLANSPRAGHAIRNANGLEGTGLIIAGVAAIAVIIVFFVLLDDNNNNGMPRSP